MSKTESNTGINGNPSQRVALLDDDSNQLDLSEGMLNRALPEAEIYSYGSLEELIEEPSAFDAYVLDHDLGGSNYSADVIQELFQRKMIADDPYICILSGSPRENIDQMLEDQDVGHHVDEIYSKHDLPYSEIAEKIYW